LVQSSVTYFMDGPNDFFRPKLLMIFFSHIVLGLFGMSLECLERALPGNRVARWFSQKYRTLAVPVSVAQNIELLTLSGITIIFIADKEPKYQTVRLNSFIHSFIQTICIAPLQVHFYSEALLTQHGYCAGVSRRSATGNCELRTYPRSLRGG